MLPCTICAAPSRSGTCRRCHDADRVRRRPTCSVCSKPIGHDAMTPHRIASRGGKPARCIHCYVASTRRASTMASVIRRPRHERATTSCPATSEPEAPPLRRQVEQVFRELKAKVFTDDDLVGVREGAES